MNTFASIFLCAGGLFDFDLTFLIEALLFFLFASVVTKTFISPISQLLSERAEHIKAQYKRTTFLTRVASDKILDSAELIYTEISEINRQSNLFRSYMDVIFFIEIWRMEDKSAFIFYSFEKQLIIHSAYTYLSAKKQFKCQVNKFFKLKYAFPSKFIKKP